MITSYTYSKHRYSNFCSANMWCARVDIISTWHTVSKYIHHFFTYRTNEPKDVMAYLDFQFDPHLPSYIHHTDMHNYLQHYVNHFNITPLIQFNTVVTSITLNGADYAPPHIGDTQSPEDPPNTGFTFHQWKVTTQNMLTKATTAEVYDAVMVCNGYVNTVNKLVGVVNYLINWYIHVY